MAIDIGQYKIAQTKQSIADRLAAQSSDLQKTPWWKTVGSIALPLLATIAMPGIGAALAGVSGTSGILGSLLGGGKTAAALAKGISTIGQGLKATGMIGKGVGGIGKTLLQTGTKGLYNIGAQALTKGALGALDPKSAQDIKVSGGKWEQMLGREAESKLRRQWMDAKEAEGQTRLLGSILSAMTQQGGGDILNMFKNQTLPANSLSVLNDLQSLEEAQKLIDTANIMGKEASPLAQVASGNQLITDASKRVGGQSTLQGLLQEQAQLSQYGISPRYQGQGLYDPLQRDRGSIIKELLKLNKTY